MQVLKQEKITHEFLFIEQNFGIFNFVKEQQNRPLYNAAEIRDLQQC